MGWPEIGQDGGVGTSKRASAGAPRRKETEREVVEREGKRGKQLQLLIETSPLLSIIGSQRSE